MANLITLEHARTALSKSDIPDVNDGLNQALAVVSSLLAATLNTDSFDDGTHAETFIIQGAHVLLHDSNPLRLKLKNPFMTDTGNIIYEYKSDPADPYEVITADVLADLNTIKGYITINSPNYTTGRLKVTYKAGLEVGDDDITQVYTGVPSWLEDAAVVTLTTIFDILKSSNSKNSKKGKGMPEVPPTALALMRPYLRTLQDCLNPVE